MNAREEVVAGSFRDPSGVLFHHEGALYRRINPVYREHYDHLLSSGLYKTLVAQDLLIEHEEADLDGPAGAGAYKIIRPRAVPFISYPYEWCFSQLQAAARLTLKIQQIALGHGMTLKDGSAYNVQFIGHQPIFIDTLSLAVYRTGQPWAAYRQFCEHFLAPLALMACRDVRLGQLLRVHLDGIPLDLAAKLLPTRTRFRFALLSHIHLHARGQKRYAGRQMDTASYTMSTNALAGLLDHLQTAVNKLHWTPAGTTWADYYENPLCSAVALAQKKRLVADFLQRIKPADVWDLGANDGTLSRLAAERGVPTIAFDADPAAVERNYRQCVANRETNHLPLLLDLTNPSPALGWEHAERSSWRQRGPAEAVMALALIHHLALANNVPLARLAEFFGKICKWLIIEFVPKSDPQAQRLLASKEDVFPDYTRQGFEDAFYPSFELTDSAGLPDSQRIVYLLRRR